VGISDTVVFGCQKHAFSMRKVDKMLGLDDHLAGNQMHHFGVANPVEQLLRVFVDFSHVEREF
jgi:hypothetical protein